MGEVHNISDIFVLPSRKEGFGLVVAEAMLMEIPVIRSNTEGAKDQIENGKNGFLFKNEDSEQLSKQLIKLMTNKGLRKMIGRKGKETAKKNFTSEKMADKTIEVYKNIINASD